MTIQFLFSYYEYFRLMQAKRPWAHNTKKGPGRKHQQTPTMTKKERDNLKKA